MNLELSPSRVSPELTVSATLLVLGLEVLLLLFFDNLYARANYGYEWYSYGGQRAFTAEMARALCWLNLLLTVHLWLTARPMNMSSRYLLLGWATMPLLLQVATFRLSSIFASGPKLVIERVIYP